MPAPAPLRVRLREHGDLFFRRHPVQLLLTDTHVLFARHRLPYAALSVAPGLASRDIVLTTAATAFCLRPVPPTHPEWPAVVAQLRMRSMAPPRYAYLDEIGRGSFGVVYKAYRLRQQPPHQLCAVKQLRKSVLRHRNLPVDVARRELQIVTAFPPHPNIVRTFSAFETQASLFIVMELVSAGTLLNHALRTPLSFHNVRLVICQLLNALAHIHSHAIIHRDVKMENILVTNSKSTVVTKLCDFGLAVRHAPSRPVPHSTSVGTRYAQAPEMVLAAEKGHSRAHYDSAVDVWACGIVLFALLYNRIPWIGHPSEQATALSAMHQLATHSKPSIQLMQTVEERLATPPLLQSLLCGLLQPLPAKRLTARAALEHKLFSDVHQTLNVTRHIQQDLMTSPVSARCAFRRVVSLVRAVECFRLSTLSTVSRPMVVL